MIVTCPQCKTAHSKSEQEIAGGGTVLCRKCGQSFQAGPATAGPISAPAASSATAPSAGKAATPPASLSGLPSDFLDLDDVLPKAPAKPAPTSPTKSTAARSAVDVAVDPLTDLLGVSAGKSPAANPPPASPPEGLKRVPAPPLTSLSEIVEAPLEPQQSASARTVTAPRAETPASTGIPEVPTGVLPADALQKRLEQMRPHAEDDTAVRLQPQGARGNVFPREAWNRFTTELGHYLQRAPRPVKIGLAAVAALLAVGLVATISTLVGPDRRILYMRETQPLLVGPRGGEVYPTLAPIERGGRVEVVLEESGYALVRDAVGRVGFVPLQSLRPEPPPAVPSQPFADCGRAPIETSVERCQGRAQSQFDSCCGLCGTDLQQEESCLRQCQTRLAECLGVCEQMGEGRDGSVRGRPAARAVEPRAQALEPASAEPVSSPAGRKAKTKRVPRKAKHAGAERRP